MNLEIHRNTWRYTRLIEHQRESLLEHRGQPCCARIWRPSSCKKADEKRWTELEEEVGAEVLEQAAREIVLFHLDRRWSDHLGFVADVRETIHLRALAKETPIDEFHRTVIPAYHKIIAEVAELAEESFKAVKATDGKLDLDSAGLRRPSSTWTYLVHDNPFDSDIEQALQRVRAMIKRKAEKD